MRFINIFIVYSERLSFLNQFVCDWNFSPLELDERDLVQCVFIMLDQTFVQLPELNSLRMKKGKFYFILPFYKKGTAWLHH